MTQPTPYTRQYNFTNFQSANPTTPLPGNQVDAELNAVKTATDGIDTNLALIQRDDGKLANGSVHQDAFSTAALLLISGWNPRGPWTTATAYAVKDMVTSGGVSYVCYIAHTSAGAIDLAKFSSIGSGIGDVIAAAANNFTAGQTITLAASGANLTLNTADTGPLGPIQDMNHNSATPASGDSMRYRFFANSSLGTSREIADLLVDFQTVTDTLEDAQFRFRTRIAGTLADRFIIKNGTYTPNATGGDKGVDTINAKNFFIDGTPAGIGPSQWGGTSGNAANAQTITLAPAITSYYTGLVVCWKAGFTNTSALTLNANGLGAKNVFNGNAACAGGEVIQNNFYAAVYDGTQFQLLGVPGILQSRVLFAEQTLTDAGPTAWNLATQQNAVWTLGASRTLSTPTNMVAGQTGNLEIRQDATGSRIITWPGSSIFKWPGGVAPTLSTAASAVDLLSYKCRAADMLVSLQKGFA